MNVQAILTALSSLPQGDAVMGANTGTGPSEGQNEVADSFDALFGFALAQGRTDTSQKTTGDDSALALTALGGLNVTPQWNASGATSAETTAPVSEKSKSGELDNDKDEEDLAAGFTLILPQPVPTAATPLTAPTAQAAQTAQDSTGVVTTGADSYPAAPGTITNPLKNQMIATAEEISSATSINTAEPTATNNDPAPQTAQQAWNLSDLRQSLNQAIAQLDAQSLGSAAPADTPEMMATTTAATGAPEMMAAALTSTPAMAGQGITQTVKSPTQAVKDSTQEEPSIAAEDELTQKKPMQTAAAPAPAQPRTQTTMTTPTRNQSVKETWGGTNQISSARSTASVAAAPGSDTDMVQTRPITTTFLERSDTTTDTDATTTTDFNHLKTTLVNEWSAKPVETATGSRMPELAEQMSQVSDYLATRAEGTIRQSDKGVEANLRLYPPDMGQVRVSLTVSSNNSAQAQFIVERPETAQLLQQHLQSFHDGMSRNGVSMERVQISVQGSSAGESAQNDMFQSNSQGQQRREQANQERQQHWNRRDAQAWQDFLQQS